MAIEIQLKRGVAANWTSLNPILAQGEIGYETNTNKFKIGDGVTDWSSLAYFTSGGVAALVDLTDVDATNKAIGKILQVGADGITHEYVDPPTGGGGIVYQTITISVADWAGGLTCSKAVTGVTATTWNDFAFAESYREKIIEFDVRPSGQGAGTITFTANSTPDAEIVFNIQIQEV